MKKPLAALATTALVGLVTLGAVTPAVAADTRGDATFYTTADFGQETATGYPTNDWFKADLSASLTPATLSSSTSGLDIDASGSNVVAQLLRQGATTPSTADDFVDAVTDIEVLASATDWTFQIAVYAEPGAVDDGYTTLRPATAGTLSGNWITSWDLRDDSGVLYPANSSASLDDIADALYAGTTPQLLAYGVWVSNTTLSLYAVNAFDNFDIFTPVPQFSMTPGTTNTRDIIVDGVTFTGSGWLPNSPVYLEVYNCDGSESILFDDEQTADANGEFSITLTASGVVNAGTYCFEVDDGIDGAPASPLFDSDAGFTGSYVVTQWSTTGPTPPATTDPTPPATSDPTAPATVDPTTPAQSGEGDDDAALAETGAQDATPWLVAAGALVLLGAAAVVLNVRMRRHIER